MAGLSRIETWPNPEYVIHQTFRAPLAFVYRWCTDFTSGDARLEKEAYERRILERSPKRVVYEDLERARDGWVWARTEVHVSPPNRWGMVSGGNRRLSRAEYTLTPIGRERTSLELRLRRRPSLLPSTRLSKRARETVLRAAWKHFARALETDYRRSLRRE